MHLRTYYAMKARLGGEKMTKHQKLCWKYYPVPGCLQHEIHPKRQEILFDHYVERPQKSCVVYWRSHPAEYQALLERINVVKRRPSVSDSL